jgi:hypothetical protein
VVNCWSGDFPVNVQTVSGQCVSPGSQASVGSAQMLVGMTGELECGSRSTVTEDVAGPDGSTAVAGAGSPTEVTVNATMPATANPAIPCATRFNNTSVSFLQ